MAEKIKFDLEAVESVRAEIRSSIRFNDSELNEAKEHEEPTGFYETRTLIYNSFLRLLDELEKGVK